MRNRDQIMALADRLRREYIMYAASVWRSRDPEKLDRQIKHVLRSLLDWPKTPLLWFQLGYYHAQIEAVKKPLKEDQ